MREAQPAINTPFGRDSVSIVFIRILEAASCFRVRTGAETCSCAYGFRLKASGKAELTVTPLGGLQKSEHADAKLSSKPSTGTKLIGELAAAVHEEGNSKSN